MSAHLILGQKGEDAALNYLLNLGYRLLARNWRFHHLELDLVLEQDDQIVFVEVKTRKSRSFGGPLAGMSPKKIQNTLSAAMAWLRQAQAWERPCRIDIVCLVGEESGFHLEHFINALSLCSGDAFGKFW